MSLILVIEDQIQILLNVQEILELEDFSVIIATDGKIGLQLAKTHNPDLIICDIMMSELDGYQVLTELRREPQTANIPLIFLTAKADPNDFREAIDLGADDYIFKPFEPADILQSVKATLEEDSRLSEI